jgi:hypothetical protein
MALTTAAMGAFPNCGAFWAEEAMEKQSARHSKFEGKQNEFIKIV